MSRSWKPSQRLLLVAAIIFVSIAVITFIMALIFDYLFTSMMLKQLTILPDSLVYKSWQKPSVPVFFSFTVFNLTNAVAVLSGSRPVFTEIGPFVYREARDRVEVKFSNETPPETVSFKQRVLHYFIPEHSTGDPKTIRITVPNLVYFGLKSSAVSLFSVFVDPFVTLTVDELIWGYKTGFPPTTVGLFHEKNGTSAEPLTIKTGVSDIASIGQIVSVGDKRVMNVWDSEEANTIKGTDGSVAAPGLSIGSKFHIFVPALCRTITTYAVGMANALNREEIELLSFSGVPPESEYNASRAWNRLFCKSNVCPPEGLVAVEPCLKLRGPSVPLFLSPPHFLNVDPAVSSAVGGISPPDKVKHSTWMRIEPNTGFVLEASQRMQFNLYISNQDLMSGNAEASYYHPIVWISEEAAADRDSLDTLYSKLLWPKKVIPIILSVICAVSSALAIVFIVLLSVGRRLYSNRRKVNVSPSSVTDGSTDYTADGDLKSVDPINDHLNHSPSGLHSTGLRSQL